MADRIMIDTVLLGDLQGQLRQLQRSLTTVNGKVVLSVSEVQRVASGQDAIIRKLQSIQRNVQKTADRTERLSRAVRDAVENWEEAEKKIASQKLPEAEDNRIQGQKGNGESLSDIFKKYGPFSAIPALIWFYNNRGKQFSAEWKSGDTWLKIEGKNPFDVLDSLLNTRKIPRNVLKEYNRGGMGAVSTYLMDVWTKTIDDNGSVIHITGESGRHFMDIGIINSTVQSDGIFSSSDITDADIAKKYSEKFSIFNFVGGMRKTDGSFEREVTKELTIGGYSVSGEVAGRSQGEYGPSLYGILNGEAFIVQYEETNKTGIAGHMDDYNMTVSKTLTALGMSGEIGGGYDGRTGEEFATLQGDLTGVGGEGKAEVNAFGVRAGGSLGASLGLGGGGTSRQGPNSYEAKASVDPVDFGVYVDSSGMQEEIDRVFPEQIREIYYGSYRNFWLNNILN